jgi:cell division septum initiation protein DivIVA
MRHANRPSGPGKPIQERRGEVAEREELEQIVDEAQGSADSPLRDPTRSARQAERAAHTKAQNTNTRSGTSGNRRRRSPPSP